MPAQYGKPMKLIINRNLLIKAVGLIIEAVDSRHRLPILGNLKLVLEPDRLTLTAVKVRRSGSSTSFKLPKIGKR